MMKKTAGILVLLVAAGGAACATRSQFLAQMQPMAMQTAVNRAKFELNCPQATGVVISQEVVQPQIMGAWGGASGLERGEYTIGVNGCGERKTFVVLCPQGGDGCFAAGPGSFLEDERQR